MTGGGLAASLRSDNPFDCRRSDSAGCTRCDECSLRTPILGWFGRTICQDWWFQCQQKRSARHILERLRHGRYLPDWHHVRHPRRLAAACGLSLQDFRVILGYDALLSSRADDVLSKLEVTHMKRYIIRLVLSACAFYFLFPVIPGVQFHGTFIHALLAGALFAFIGWIVEFLAIAVSALLTITTLGMALIVLIPAWLFGFWLIPAVILRIVADFMPATLTFSGWLPAIGGGLLMLVIGMITGGDTHKKVRGNGNTRVIVI